MSNRSKQQSKDMGIHPRIAIIGAGLTLACLLQRHGIAFQVFERDANRSVRGQGGSLDLHEGSAQAALREAGLYERFMKHARPEGEVLKIYDPQSNVLMDESRAGGGSRPTGEFEGRPEIDRIELRNLLLDAVEPARIIWGRQLQRLEYEAAGGTSALHFADGSIEVDFDLVVGADGAWSRVRGVLSHEQPYYSGVGGLDLKFTEVERQQPHIAERIGQGMALTLGRSKGLMAQRNGDGSARVYAFVRSPEEDYAAFVARTQTEPDAVKREMLDKFYYDFDAASQRLVLDSDDELYVRPMYMLPIGIRWEHKPGLTLMGDAAHLMAPFAGVGVNVGMQDALDLSRELVRSREQDEWASRDRMHAALALAVPRYEVNMWERSVKDAQATWMYLNLFFNERGGHAMIEHFEKQKHKEAENKKVEAGKEMMAA